MCIFYKLHVSQLYQKINFTQTESATGMATPSMQCVTYHSTAITEMLSLLRGHVFQMRPILAN